MSSMRNAIQRRNHRERAQPRERSKWGILEKHKVIIYISPFGPFPSTLSTTLQNLSLDKYSVNI